MLLVLCALPGGGLEMKSKKGHFDIATLFAALIGGAIAYAITQKHMLKRHFNEESKNENAIRVRK